MQHEFSPIQQSHIIEMAWCDKTSFEQLSYQTGASLDQVKEIMKKNLKFSSYRIWKERLKSKKYKHQKRYGDLPC